MGKKKKKQSKYVHMSKAFRGIPKSGWIASWEDRLPGVKRKPSTQSLLLKEVSVGKNLSIDGLISDTHMYRLNPKLAKYRMLRKEGKTEW